MPIWIKSDHKAACNTFNLQNWTEKLWLFRGQGVFCSYVAALKWEYCMQRSMQSGENCWIVVTWCKWVEAVICVCVCPSGMTPCSTPPALMHIWTVHTHTHTTARTHPYEGTAERNYPASLLLEFSPPPRRASGLIQVSILLLRLLCSFSLFFTVFCLLSLDQWQIPHMQQRRE